jgi:K+-transporting ATPase c subunit
MFKCLSSSILLLGLTIIICCGIYPLTVWAIGKVFFPFQANGSLLKPIFYSERHSFLGRSSPGAAWRAIEVPLSQKCSAISLA